MSGIDDRGTSSSAVVLDPDSALGEGIADFTGAPYVVQLCVHDTWTTIGAAFEFDAARRECRHFLRSSANAQAARVIRWSDAPESTNGDDRWETVFERRARPASSSGDAAAARAQEIAFRRRAVAEGFRWPGPDEARAAGAATREGGPSEATVGDGKASQWSREVNEWPDINSPTGDDGAVSQATWAPASPAPAQRRRHQDPGKGIRYTVGTIAIAGLLTTMLAVYQGWFSLPQPAGAGAGATAAQQGEQSAGRSTFERYLIAATPVPPPAEPERPAREVTTSWELGAQQVALARLPEGGQALVFDGNMVLQSDDPLSLRTIVRFDPYDVAVLEVQRGDGACATRTILFAVNTSGETQLEGPFGGCHTSFFVTTLEQRVLIAFPQPGAEPMHLYVWYWGVQPHRIAPDQLNR